MISSRNFFAALVTIMFIASATLGSAAEWLVLPDSLSPCKSPSKRTEDKTISLRYKQSICEKAIVPSLDPGKDAGIRWISFDYEGRECYIPEPYAVRKTEGADGANLPVGSERVDMQTPLALDYEPADLVNLNPSWSYHNGGKIRLRREVAQAAEHMLASARGEGIELRVASAYRSAMQQRANYLPKVRRDGMLQNVIAKPGHSEHQLGTTLDLAAVNPKTFLDQSFGDSPEGIWLKKNAPRFGFRISYTKENAARTGYIPEPWHIRYLGKLAAQ